MQQITVSLSSAYTWGPPKNTWGPPILMRPINRHVMRRTHRREGRTHRRGTAPSVRFFRKPYKFIQFAPASKIKRGLLRLKMIKAIAYAKRLKNFVKYGYHK